MLFPYNDCDAFWWSAVKLVRFIACIAAVGLANCQPDSMSTLDLPRDANSEVAAADLSDTQEPVRRLFFGIATGDDHVSCADAMSCRVFVSFNKSRSLPVLLLQDGLPLEGTTVRFDLSNDPHGVLSLSASTATSGKDGVASVVIHRGKPDFADAQVRVCVDGDPEIGCLIYRVGAIGVEYAVLRVSFLDYIGQFVSELTNTQVYLFRQGTSGKPRCAELAIESLPSASVVSPPMKSLTATAVFPELPGLEKDLIQSYTIVGLARNDAGKVMAWACDDNLGHVAWEKMTFVDLLLEDFDQ